MVCLTVNFGYTIINIKQSRQDALSVTKWDVVCERKNVSAVSCRVRCIFILGIKFSMKMGNGPHRKGSLFLCQKISIQSAKRGYLSKL